MDAVVPSSEPPAETPRAGHAYYPAPPRGQGQRDLHWIVQQPRQPPAPLPDAGPATTPGLPTFQGQAARCPSVRVCTFTQVESKGRGPVTVTPSSFELSLELSDLPGGTDPGNSSVASQAQPSEGRSSPHVLQAVHDLPRAPPPPRTSLRSSTQARPGRILARRPEVTRSMVEPCVGRRRGGCCAAPEQREEAASIAGFIQIIEMQTSRYDEVEALRQ